MNLHVSFARYCAWVVLSVYFSGSYALLLRNELSPNDYSSSTSNIRAYDIDFEDESLRRNDERPIGREEERRYVVTDIERQGEDKNCASRSINDFPRDLFTYEQRRYGAVILHAFLGFYCFALTAMVCHDYLLPALDRICVGMNISSDIAGATFLALASAFPEMFINVVGTFLTQSDLGVGTVVGSAVFDTFATPACGALTTLHAIPLEWRILSRDCIMYVVSVGTLVIVMWDGWITSYEAIILLILFVIYLTLLLGGTRIIQCCGKIVRFCFDERTGSTMKLNNVEENSSIEGSRVPYAIGKSTESTNVEKSEKQGNGTNDPESLCNGNQLERKQPKHPFAWPKKKSKTMKFWFILTWPLKFLLFVTIPDTRHERLKNWYPLTFVMCVIWIAISSYLVSWMMTAVGDTIGIPDSIMGITFLAAGGNMPEVASIVILAKQGDGNMAMSNTLGANILDILLCLGLPWTIKCLMTGRDVMIVSEALSYSVLSIIGCIVVLYAVIAFFNFKLNKKVGFICLLLYTIFLVFAILIELNTFFTVNPPMCEY